MRDDHQANADSAVAQGPEVTGVEHDQDPGAELGQVDTAGISSRLDARNAARERLIQWLPPHVRRWLRHMIGNRDLSKVIKTLMEHGLSDNAVFVLVEEPTCFDLDEQISRCRKDWKKAGGKFAPGSTAEFFRKLLATHFVVMVGGNAYIATWRQSLLPGNAEELDLIKYPAFGIFYGNRMWFGPDGRGQLKAIPISKPFAGLAKRYSALVYAPGEGSEVNGGLNLWRGFGVKPVPGSWTLMKAHILDVLADGDEAVADYIIRWAAWAVQNPGNQAEVALVFKGGKGVGKGMFGRSMARLFGGHGLQIAEQKQAPRRFKWVA